MILNLMLGKKRGGLEQAALDYAEALALAGLASRSIIAPGAWIGEALGAAHHPVETLANFGAWDWLAALRLSRMAQRQGAQTILCHGNRALCIALRAKRLARAPLRIIAVAHNYSTKRHVQADASFAITEHLAQHLRAQGIQHIVPMPNMVRLTEAPARPAFRDPPVIGSMGRFVSKKGFDLYIEALAILASRGVAFRAVLGGEGELKPALETLINRHGLAGKITLTGWVTDKQAFLNGLDIFVLPSHHEPFGIVLLEALAARLPVVTTDAEGPREIITHGTHALLTPRHDATAMADALAQLIANPAQARALGDAGYALAREKYSMQAMAMRLKSALASPI